MGVSRYVAFYFICGLGANALEIATSVGSNAPRLGASGAIAGVLAGDLALYPRSHVRTLVTLGFFFWCARVPAWIFIGLWFLLQLVNGLASISNVNPRGIAYSAHLRAFITVLLLL